MPQVTVHNDFYPEGEEIEIAGLGSVPNHGTKELSDNQVLFYKAAGYEWPEDDHLVIEIKDISHEEAEEIRAKAAVDNDPFVRLEDGSIDWEASDVPSDLFIGTTKNYVPPTTVIDGRTINSQPTLSDNKANTNDAPVIPITNPEGEAN
jgi:hypothetical protein